MREKARCLAEVTGLFHQPTARRDDREVARAAVLLAAVVDGAHAFLYRTVLVVDAPDSGVAHRALDLAVEQIVVLHVALRQKRSGYQFGRKRATCAAYRKVLIGQRPIRVVRDVESHGAIVVDRNPGASAGREAHERNEAIVGSRAWVTRQL